jgi:secreted protein with Ig-like and vWFA domain
MVEGQRQLIDFPEPTQEQCAARTGVYSTVREVAASNFVSPERRKLRDALNTVFPVYDNNNDPHDKIPSGVTPQAWSIGTSGRQFKAPLANLGLSTPARTSLRLVRHTQAMLHSVVSYKLLQLVTICYLASLMCNNL